MRKYLHPYRIDRLQFANLSETNCAEHEAFAQLAHIPLNATRKRKYFHNFRMRVFGQRSANAGAPPRAHLQSI